MVDNIKNGTKRVLSGVVGFDRNGKGGVQLVNRSRNNVAIFGDSLNAAQLLTQMRRASTSGINAANALAGQRMRFTMNKAVSGTRLDQILLAVRTAISDGSLVASGTGTLLLNGGTNDAAQAGAGFTDVITGASITTANVVDNCMAKLTEIIDSVAALGIQTILRNVHGATNMSAAQIALVEDLNRRIRRLPLGRPMFLFETRGILRDPATTTSAVLAMRSGRTYDGLHTSPSGGYFEGKDLSEIVKVAIPPLPSSYSDATDLYSTNHPAELLDNPAFTGTGGGAPGTGGTLGLDIGGGALAGLPTGYVAVRQSGDTTTTFTINRGQDAEGTYMEFVVTASVQGGGVRFQSVPGSPATKISPADILQGFAKIEVISGAVNLASACPYMDFSATVSGSTTSYITNGMYSSGVQGAYPSTEGFIFEDATEEMTVPNFTAVQFITCRPLDMIFAGAGSATVRVRKPRFEKLAAIPALAA